MPSLVSNDFEGVTTKTYEPIGFMKSKLYRWKSYMDSAERGEIRNTYELT